MRHRPRRLRPGRILRPILELAEEERLECYIGRWRALCDRAAQDDNLAADAEQLARAMSVMPGAPPAPPPEWLTLTLAALRVAGYWRTRRLASGRRLPLIATTPTYFDTPPAMLHWLDIEAPCIPEAAFERDEGRHEQRRRHVARSRLGDDAVDVLDGYLIEVARHDPVGAASGPLLSPVLARLTALAHSGSRPAAARMATIVEALRPDFRGYVRERSERRYSPRHARLRARSAELGAALREAQEEFRMFCAAQNPGDLPPPLRTPPLRTHCRDV